MFSFVPRSQGLCEWANIDLDMRPMREQLMLGHLFILVVGQGPCHLLGQGAHLSGKGLSAIRRILHSQAPGGSAGRPLHECAERRGVPAPHDQIPLSVAWHHPTRHLGGTLLDAPQRGNGVASLRTAPPHSPIFPSVPKRLEQFSFERTARAAHTHTCGSSHARHASWGRQDTPPSAAWQSAPATSAAASAVAGPMRSLS